MNILETFGPLARQLFQDVRGESVTYQSLAGEPVTVTAIVDRGPEFEAANPGMHCAVTMTLADLPSTPRPGDSIALSGSAVIVQVVREGIAIDNYGGVTVLCRRLRSDIEA